MKFHSLDILSKNIGFQSTVTQSVDNATAARMVPGSSLGHSFLFGQKLGTCLICQRIRKSSLYYNTTLRMCN